MLLRAVRGLYEQIMPVPVTRDLRLKQKVTFLLALGLFRLQGALDSGVGSLEVQGVSPREI